MHKRQGGVVIAEYLRLYEEALFSASEDSDTAQIMKSASKNNERRLQNDEC